MKGSVFVIFNERGIIRTVKSQRFELKAGEYVTEVILEVPDELFKPVRAPSIHIEIDPHAIRRPVVALPASEEASASR